MFLQQLLDHRAIRFKEEKATFHLERSIMMLQFSDGHPWEISHLERRLVTPRERLDFHASCEKNIAPSVRRCIHSDKKE